MTHERNTKEKETLPINTRLDTEWSGPIRTTEETVIDTSVVGVQGCPELWRLLPLLHLLHTDEGIRVQPHLCWTAAGTTTIINTINNIVNNTVNTLNIFKSKSRLEHNIFLVPVIQLFAYATYVNGYMSCVMYYVRHLLTEMFTSFLLQY